MDIPAPIHLTLLIFIQFMIIVKGKWVVRERDEILDTYYNNGKFTFLLTRKLNKFL